MSNSTFQQSNNGGGGTQIVLTANEDLVAGQTVGIASNLENQAMQAVSPNREQEVSLVISDSIGRSVLATCQIDTNKYVVLCSEAVGGVSFFAVIAELNDDMTWTLGAPSAILAFSSSGLESVTLVKVTSTSFAFVFIDDTTDGVVRVIGCTVSGTTITLGASDTYSALNNAYTLDAVYLSDDSIAVLITGESGSSGVVSTINNITFSGSTPTAGTYLNLNSIGLNNKPGVMVKTNTDEVAIAVNDKIISATLSAGTWTQTNATVSSGSTNDVVLGIASITTDIVYAVFAVSITELVVYIYDVSGTPTLVASGTVTVANANTGATTLLTDGTSVYLANGASITIREVIESGSDVLIPTQPAVDTGLTPNTNTDTTGIFKNVCQNSDDGFFITFTAKTLINGTTDIATLNYHIQGMTNLYTGIVQNTVSRGGSAIVKLSGIDGNQTGLIPGATYEPSAGGLRESTGLTPYTLQATSATTINI